MRITKATYKDTTVVANLIAKLLIDFNLENGRSFNVDMNFLESATKKLIVRNNYAAFIAYNETNYPIGLITVAEAFAVYNGGDYGVVTELYVNENYRSKGIGKLLLKSAFNFSKTKNWKKIEVGAPNANEWPRTINFYQKNGFKLKGPKLRIEL